MFGINAYTVFGVSEYLQVAFSFVWREIVVWVVPDGSWDVGEGVERMGGVRSADTPEVIKILSLLIHWLCG